MKKEVSDSTKKKRFSFGSKANVNAKSGILFKALKPFMSLDTSANIEGGFKGIGESAIKSTISNTILSDFIETAEDDTHIKKIKNYNITAYQNSISFMKMYTPYFNMIKMEDESINFSKLDETLEKSKGYYELLATTEDGPQKVLRFNIKAFRNNYSLADLPKMNLKFYSVEVGSMDVSMLNAEKEFDFGKDKEPITSSEILNEQTDEVNKVIVYDVILSGISSNE
jgi:hypothetical protein